MARREVLSPSQRRKLDDLAVDLDDRQIARHHTLSEEELALVRKRRGSANRLGFAVLLALLKYPGRPMRPNEGAPEKIVRYVASQVGEDPRAMVSYRRARKVRCVILLDRLRVRMVGRPFGDRPGWSPRLDARCDARRGTRGRRATFVDLRLAPEAYVRFTHP